MAHPSKYLDPAGDQLKAVFLLGTLKPKKKGEFSHTETLCGLVIENLCPYNVKSEIVRLVEYDIKPGVESDMGRGDEWPGILTKVIAADIIVFATPIWWGIQSSLIQRVIERMDALNDELLETGKSELANKVGGIVITGAEEVAAQEISRSEVDRIHVADDDTQPRVFCATPQGEQHSAGHERGEPECGTRGGGDAGRSRLAREAPRCGVAINAA